MHACMHTSHPYTTWTEAKMYEVICQLHGCMSESLLPICHLKCCFCTTGLSHISQSLEFTFSVFTVILPSKILRLYGWSVAYKTVSLQLISHLKWCVCTVWGFIRRSGEEDLMYHDQHAIVWVRGAAARHTTLSRKTVSSLCACAKCMYVCILICG